MKHAKFICHLKLTYCALLMCFPQFIIGCSYGYSSTLLTQLREHSSTINLNINEESWITSISMLVCPIGLIVIGILMDRIGRRKALQVIYIAIILSWLILAFANSYKTILIARIIQGIPYGISICVVLYVAELCPANLRPLYVSLFPICACFGMMFQCVLAVRLHWQTISAVLFALSIVNFLTLFSVSETPMWLRSKGRDQEADRADKWFDLKHVDATVVGEPSENGINAARDRTADEPASYWSQYLQPNVWKPMTVTVLFFTVQQFSGAHVLLFYSGTVLRDFRISGNGTVIVYAAQILGSLSFALCHRVMRRTLVIVSGGSMAAVITAAVTYTKIFGNVEHPPYRWIPIISFSVFIYFAFIGVVPTPWILYSEVFPIAIRGVVSGIVQAIGFLLWFSACKMYPWMVSTLGIEIIWSIFSIFCVLDVLYAIFIMPETQGKTLEQVLLYYESPKKK